MIPGKRYSPDELLSLVWSRRRLVIVSTLLVAVTVYGISLFVPNRYQSETLVLIVPQKVPNEVVVPTNTSPIEARLNSISQQILSRSSLEAFITQYNLYPRLRGEESIDSLVLRMRDDIKVEVVKGDSFRVRYTSEDPQTAQLMATQLAAAYITENVTDRDTANKKTTAFLKTELSDAKIRLEQQEHKLEEYRLRHSGELPTQFSANQDALSNARIQLRAAGESITRARERRVAIDSEIAHLTEERIPPAIVSAPVSADAPGATVEQQLVAARAKFAEVSVKFTPEHPDWRAAARKVKELEADLARINASTPTQPGASAVVATVDPAESARQNRLRQLRLDLASIDRQIASEQGEELRLRGDVALLQRRLDSTPTRETELVALTRDYETIKDIYTSLLMRSENSKLAEKLEEQKVAEQFKVLDPAKVPERPVSPNRLRLTIVGAFAGLCLALGFIAFGEFRDGSLRTEDDITICIGLPVIAVIPVLSQEAAANRGRVKRLVGALTGAASALVAAASVFLR